MIGNDLMFSSIRKDTVISTWDRQGQRRPRVCGHIGARIWRGCILP